jgi:hypothetical protein
VDFTETPCARGCKYLLVFVCTFSGWVEAFSTWTEKAWKVARYPLRKIIHWFRIPVSLRLENGLAFVPEVVPLVAKDIGITWKLTQPTTPRVQKSRTNELNSKIAIGKTMPGDFTTMGSVTTQSFAWD